MTDTNAPSAQTPAYGTRFLTFQPIMETSPPGVPEKILTNLKFPNGISKQVDIDTGSLGIVIPHELVSDPVTGNYYPWAAPTGQIMTIIYMPSKVTISGPLVKVSGLTLADGRIPIDPVTVLAYTLGHDTYMMGIGFGLEAIGHFGYPNAPQPGSTATALDNPLLAVTGMSREPGADFQAAYSLTAAVQSDGSAGQVTLGQTAASVAGFRFLPIAPRSTAPAGYELPWIDVTVTPAGTSSQPVTSRAQMLMDTGIGSMFLAFFTPSPPRPGQVAQPVPLSLPGAAVRIQARDGAGNTVLDYGFVNAHAGGDSRSPNTDKGQPASPSEILHGGHSPQGGSFINTGIHVLALYDYHVDATFGQVGFRAGTAF